MIIEDFLDPADVHVGLRSPDKGHLLHELSLFAGQALSLSTDTILAALVMREELGSTGMGDGVAIPHARLPEIKVPFGLMVTLRSPIDFHSVDDRPVDLVFLLLLPTGSTGGHLGALAAVSRKLREPDVAGALRRARGALDGFAALVSGPPAPSAIRASQ